MKEANAKRTNTESLNKKFTYQIIYLHKIKLELKDSSDFNLQYIDRITNHLDNICNND